MAITRQDWAPQDSIWDLVRKILTNLNGLIRGDFGILTRGTFEIAPSTTTTAATPGYGTKAIPTAGTAVALAAVSTLVNSVIIVPARANTGRIFYGSTVASGAQTVEIPATLVAPDGKKIDLSLIYVDATVSGDVAAYESIT